MAKRERSYQKDRGTVRPHQGRFKPNDLPKGPLVLQGDHGPVAFRNIWVVPLDFDKGD